MKNVFLRDKYIPLGDGIKAIDFASAKKWLYLVPSAALIQPVKDMILREGFENQKYIEISTFDQMMRSVLVNEKRRVLSQEEQELLVKRAIDKINDEKGLHYFGDSIHKTGLVRQIEVWIGEMKRGGVTPTQLSTVWSNHSEKFIELTWIYEAYQELLHQYGFIDHEEPYFEFLQKKNAEISLGDYEGIIADQFYDLSPIQMKVLSRLAELGYQVNVHVVVDDLRKELFRWNYNTIDYLKALGFQPNTDRYATQEQENRTIEHLRKSLFLDLPSKANASGITLISLAGIKQEVETAAAEIKKLTSQHDIPLADIAIIAPQLEKYKETIHQIMGKAGIPTRLRKREPLVQNPFVQSMVSLLKLPFGQKKDWLSIIYSPYFKFKQEIVPSKLMMIIRELQFPMTAEKWGERFNGYLNRNEENRTELLAYDEVMKQIYNIIAAIPSKGKNKGYVGLLDKLEDELKMRQAIQSYFIKNPTEETAFRDIKAYEKWQELKRDLVSLDSLFEEAEEVTHFHFLHSLILAAEKSNYDYTQGKSSGVHVMEPNQLRGRQFKAVFILGLTDGEFPRPIKNDWLMPDQERFTLRKFGFQLNSSRDYENQQRYHFYQSVIATLDRLYLIYSAKTEDGKEKLRSFFVEELLELFKPESIQYKTLEISDVVPRSWEDCVYDRQLLNKTYFTLSNIASNHLENNDTEGAKWVKSNLGYYKQKNTGYIDHINKGIAGELKRWDDASEYDGVLNDSTNLDKIKLEIESKVWSTTQLNSAINCRFAHFAQNVLKLTEWQEQEESLSAIEKGDILHRILQRFFGGFRDGEEAIDPINGDDYLQILLDLAEEEWNLFLNKDGRYVDSLLSELDWEKLKKDLLRIFSHEMYWRSKSNSNFHPRFLELSFGLPFDEEMIKNGEVDPNSSNDKAEIKLQNRSLLLRGKIDRVDVNEDGKFVVYDYKSGNAADFKQIFGGQNLQLPLYILVIDSLLKLGIDNAVGASFYTQGGKKNPQGEITDNRNKGIWKKDHIDLVGISNRISARVTEDEWQNWIETIKQKLEDLILAIEKGDYAVLPETECPTYCQFKYICRKDEERIKQKKRKEVE